MHELKSVVQNKVGEMLRTLRSKAKMPFGHFPPPVGGVESAHRSTQFTGSVDTAVGHSPRQRSARSRHKQPLSLCTPHPHIPLLSLPPAVTSDEACSPQGPCCLGGGAC